jgi:uncharacterized membrane protein
MKVGDIVKTIITIQPNVVEEERSKSAGQQADANLKKSSQTMKEKQQRDEMGHVDDIEILERSATVKPPSLFDWYCILRAQHHWTVFQAIRFALWLAR